MRLKVVYVVSQVDKALALEWITNSLDINKFDLSFILLGSETSPLISFLKAKGIRCHIISFSGKKDVINVWMKVFKVLRNEKPQIIHTQLYYANLIGLSAGWLLRIPKRIHTRHHASLHHQFYPKTVYLDKLINSFSTDIIALSNNQKEILTTWEGVAIEKIHLIPHGFDLDYLSNANPEYIRLLRSRYKINEDCYPVIGIIARYTQWKGVQFAIPAFAKLTDKFPNAHLVLSNARGDYENEIKSLLKLLPAGSYTEIQFENDLASLYKLFDVFVHVPVDSYCEAFGQTYVEALAAEVPSVFTLSGIAKDFVEHGKNALVVDFENSQAITNAIENILSDPILKEALIAGGKASVERLFPLGRMIERIEALYLQSS